MTFVEVITALAVFSLLLAGILSVLLQTRRLSAASVAQNCAVTIVQGYIEQIKNLPLQQFVNATPGDPLLNPNLSVSFALPTLKDRTPGNEWIQLKTTPSTVAASTLLAANPGTTPTGAVDNLQSFDMDSRAAAGTTTWAAIWPGATSYPPSPPTGTTPASNANVPGRSDLRMNFWVQITDLTPTSSAKSKCYGILIVYTWQYLDGSRIRYARDSIRAARSAVQTF